VFSGNFAAGACSGKAVTVGATGSAAFDVPPMSAVALHVGAKL
jgi:alpha-amylase